MVKVLVADQDDIGPDHWLFDPDALAVVGIHYQGAAAFDLKAGVSMPNYVHLLLCQEDGGFDKPCPTIRVRWIIPIIIFGYRTLLYRQFGEDTDEGPRPKCGQG
jgi:hypothetical protein